MQCITCSKLVDSFKVFFSFSWGSLLIELEVCFVIFFLHKKNQDSPPTHPSLYSYIQAWKSICLAIICLTRPKDNQAELFSIDL